MKVKSVWMEDNTHCQRGFIELDVDNKGDKSKWQFGRVEGER